jgi:hypothetical protein
MRRSTVFDGVSVLGYAEYTADDEAIDDAVPRFVVPLQVIGADRER